MRFFNKPDSAPEPPESPADALKGVASLLAWIAAANVVAGVLAVGAQWDFAIAQGGGPLSIAVGLAYGALAFLARRGYKWAAPAGVGLFVLDSLVAISGALTGGNSASIWMLSRILIAYYLIQGARGAMRPPASV
ncbi:MAG TPA: hypothetical protein PKY66_01135 [Thermoflexales bacterium]|jgi:hypothetical protein|nr:hypothetical protein [Anaerolineae bacterium]HQX08987.1 hypothetical protein [Thermoflexales bacterium]